MPLSVVDIYRKLLPKTQVKLLFDETISEHLDIESIIFPSERLRQLLCGDQGDDQE